jgi:hypothetical protein
MASLKYAFRLVHISNIPNILINGFVHKDSPRADPNYIPIGDTSVIDVREHNTIHGIILGKYIPFYLGPRSPMLYVVQHGYNGVTRYNPEDLVYCIVLLADIITSRKRCIFTDGHALNYITKFYGCDQLSRINDFVRYADVHAKCWIDENDRDLKRRKEAELLLEDELSPDFIKGFVVYNQEAFDKLISFGIAPERIIVKQEYYF